MICYDSNKVQAGDTLTFQYDGGTHRHKLRTLYVEDRKGNRIYCKEDDVIKCFLLDKIESGWFEISKSKPTSCFSAPRVDFSVNLDTVLNMLAVTHPVHSVDFDGKKFNFYRKN